MMKFWNNSEDSTLLILLSKSDVCAYEQEYRLVAQERSEAVKGADTLLTDQSFLASFGRSWAERLHQLRRELRLSAQETAKLLLAPEDL